jgi:hypothetical protein
MHSLQSFAVRTLRFSGARLTTRSLSKPTVRSTLTSQWIGWRAYSQNTTPKEAQARSRIGASIDCVAVVLTNFANPNPNRFSTGKQLHCLLCQVLDLSGIFVMNVPKLKLHVSSSYNKPYWILTKDIRSRTLRNQNLW